MKDPNRLIDAGATEVERCLLRAAIVEEPSPSAARRAAAALGVSSAIGLTAHTVAAGTAKAVLIKLVWVGAATGAAALGWLGYQALPPPVESPSAPPAPAVHAPSVSKPPSAPPRATLDPVENDKDLPPPVAAEPPEPRRPRAVRTKPPPAELAPTQPPSVVAAEISHLDSVRAALSRGEAQQALAKLDAYAQKHPRALLGQEAVLLRIEALVQAGNRAKAAALARRFLASQPQSPHKKRIESIVGPVTNRASTP